MQSKYLSAIALAAGSVALGIQGVGHAVAADLGGYAPPPPAAAYEPIAPTWQGLYFGLNGGYGFADTGGAETTASSAAARLVTTGNAIRSCSALKVTFRPPIYQVVRIISGQGLSGAQRAISIGFRPFAHASVMLQVVL